MAMFDAVRDEWENTAKAAGLERELAIARKLMAKDGYGADAFPLEPICGHPGAKPSICMVDGKEAVCYDHSLAGAMPLSAYYANKVSEAIDIASMVGENESEHKTGNAEQVAPGGPGSSESNAGVAAAAPTG